MDLFSCFVDAGSFCASSCEGKTVNSCWSSPRRWRRTRRGGLTDEGRGGGGHHRTCRGGCSIAKMHEDPPPAHTHSLQHRPCIRAMQGGGHLYHLSWEHRDFGPHVLAVFLRLEVRFSFCPRMPCTDGPWSPSTFTRLLPQSAS